MAGFNFVSGHANPVGWQAVNAGVVLLNVTASSWTESINALIVTHSGTGGLAARLANVLDGEGTFEADYDADVSPYLNPPRLRPGVNGLYLFFVTPLRFFQCPIMILKVPYKTAVLSKVSYTVDVALNALAGSYIVPAA